MNSPKPTGWSFGPIVILLVFAQTLFGGIVAALTPPFVRPLVVVVTTVVSTMIVCAAVAASRRVKLVALVCASMLSTIAIYAWRSWLDPAAFFGPLPVSLESTFQSVYAIGTILCASIVVFFSGRDTRIYRFRWLVVLLLSCPLAASFYLVPSRGASDARGVALRVNQAHQLEESFETLDAYQKQVFSTLLATLGRGSEAYAFSTRAGGKMMAAQVAPEDEAELASEVSSAAVKWDIAIREIAARERVVIIMEAHNATEHREWIEQTLPIFREEGFTIYAAEALSENGAATKRRGFPTETTGFYVSDPRFGNLIRRAIQLDFQIADYEAILSSGIEDREKKQAKHLASIMESNPDCKIVIHAGYAHALKKPIPPNGKWMAARLWDLTGLEPYCIYQSMHEFDSPQLKRVAAWADVTEKPKVLIPPPALTDFQFAHTPSGAIDALVIHPENQFKSPAQRRPIFWEGLTQVKGRWDGVSWPVVIGAYRVGEPAGAIPLDQIMLKNGETDFELWLPAPEHVLRVTSATGSVAIEVERVEERAIVRRQVKREN